MAADHGRERVCVQSLPECTLLMHACIQRVLSAYCVLERSAAPSITWYLSTCTKSTPEHSTQMTEHLLYTDLLLDMDPLGLVLPTGAHPGGPLLSPLGSPARVHPLLLALTTARALSSIWNPGPCLRLHKGGFSDSKDERINGLQAEERILGS